MKVISTMLLERLGQHLWGFKPRLMSHFVEQYGPMSALTWFAGNMPTYERILKEWGPIRTHLVATTASLIKGCRYCTFGHAYAFQLHYLKDRGKLFPLSDSEILELQLLSKEGLVETLCSALRDSGLVNEIAFVTRTVELMSDDFDVSESGQKNNQDQRIQHLISMFAKLNACGIRDNVEPDEAHDPINKNKTLIERYAQMRAE